MRVVFDSNVLLAGLGTRGLCEAIMEACLAAHEMFISEAILVGVEEHLADKFKMSATRIKEIVSFLKSECKLVDPAPVPKDACRDPDDLMVLGTGVAARADCIVTGDQDLLTLTTFQGIAILSPRAFYDRLK